MRMASHCINFYFPLVAPFLFTRQNTLTETNFLTFPAATGINWNRWHGVIDFTSPLAVSCVSIHASLESSSNRILVHLYFYSLQMSSHSIHASLPLLVDFRFDTKMFIFHTDEHSFNSTKHSILFSPFIFFFFFFFLTFVSLCFTSLLFYSMQHVSHHIQTWK